MRLQCTKFRQLRFCLARVVNDGGSDGSFHAVSSMLNNNLPTNRMDID